METNHAIMTADELLAMGDIGRCELVRGELVRMSLNTFEHGAVAAQIGWRLDGHAQRNQLGIVTATGTGFWIARNPDTVRAPDVGFVSKERIRTLSRRGFFEGAPDLAVEVISPDDSWSEVSAKAAGWLQAGTKLVWVVDPSNRTVTVYSPSTDVKILNEQDTLDAGEVVPGFRVAVRDLFPTLP